MSLCGGWPDSSIAPGVGKPPKIVPVLQLAKEALHFQLGSGEITAIRKVLTLLAVLPCIYVNGQLAISVPWSLAVNRDLKDLSSERLPKFKHFQVGVNGAKATFHDGLSLPSYRIVAA
jgi:hypothetical protein